MIFEDVVVYVLYFWFIRCEQIVSQADIAITYVFRGEGEKDFLNGAIVEGAGENVEENEKGRLAAVGEGDIFRLYVPAK